MHIFKNCSSMGLYNVLKSFRCQMIQCRSHMGHKSCQLTCSSKSSSLRSSVVPVRNLLLHVHSTGWSFLQATCSCFNMWFSNGYSMHIVSEEVLAGEQPA